MSSRPALYRRMERGLCRCRGGIGIPGVERGAGGHGGQHGRLGEAVLGQLRCGRRLLDADGRVGVVEGARHGRGKRLLLLVLLLGLEVVVEQLLVEELLGSKRVGEGKVGALGGGR